MKLQATFFCFWGGGLCVGFGVTFFGGGGEGKDWVQIFQVLAFQCAIRTLDASRKCLLLVTSLHKGTV